MWPVHCHQPVLYNFNHIKRQNAYIAFACASLGCGDIDECLIANATLAIWTHNTLS